MECTVVPDLNRGEGLDACFVVGVWGLVVQTSEQNVEVAGVQGSKRSERESLTGVSIRFKSKGVDDWFRQGSKWCGPLVRRGSNRNKVRDSARVSLESSKWVKWLRLIPSEAPCPRRAAPSWTPVPSLAEFVEAGGRAWLLLLGIRRAIALVPIIFNIMDL